MNRLMSSTAAALLIVAAQAVPAFAGASDSGLAGSPVLQQRIDTEEVLLPPPPSGPSTPVPYCSPGSAICP